MKKTKKKAVVVPRMEKAKGYIDRVKALLVEQRAYGVDITDVCSEAKEKDGLDPSMIRFAAREALIEESVRQERDEKRNAYLQALGLAVESVRAGEMSLREAGRVYRLPKSNIHRALAVPQPSHNAETGEVTDGEEAPSRAASIHSQDDRDATRGEAAPVHAGVRQTGHACDPGSAQEGVAAQLRGQLAASTDPERLEREIERLTRADASDCEARDGLQGPVQANAVPEKATHPPQDAPPAIQSHLSSCGGDIVGAVVTPDVRPEDGDGRPRPGRVMPAAAVWQKITCAHHAREEKKRAEREAAKERRRAERAALLALNARVDKDDLKIPEFLRRPRERLESASPRSIHASEA